MRHLEHPVADEQRTLRAALWPSGFTPRILDTDPELFGRRVVTTAELSHALGPTTFAVYCDAIQVRSSNDGHYDKTRFSTARDANMSKAQVKKSMARLAKFGLVKLESRSWKMVKGKRVAWRNDRVVFGMPNMGHMEAFAVPEKTSAMVKERTKKLKTPVKGVRTRKAKRSFYTLKAKSSEPKEVKREMVPPPREKVPQNTAGEYCYQLSSLREERAKPEAASHFASDLEASHDLKASKPLKADTTLAKVSAEGASTPKPESVKGSAPIGSLQVPRRDGPRVPAFPGDALTKPAVLPSAPMIPAHLSVKEAVWWLVLAYRGAAKRFCKVDREILTFRTVERYKHYKKLCAAVKIMRELEIAPAEWAAWRLTAALPDGANVMPLDWVYSPEALEKNVGWFEHSMVNLEGLKLPNPYASDLVRRHGNMMVMLRYAHSELRQEVIIDLFFPPGKYEDLLEKARRKAAEDQALINKRRNEGQWVWP